MKYLDFILRILFPPRCLSCEATTAAGVVCKMCFARIPLYATLFCSSCNARLPVGKKICHQDALYILGAAGPYDDPVLKLLVHQLKFRGVRRAAEPIAELLARYLENAGANTNGSLLVPLPLSRERRRERGFNQAEEIARYLAERTPLCVRDDILKRNRHTKPQTETRNAADRRTNVLGCFSVVKPDAVFHKNIIILDDVTTSGATLREAALVLKAAGAHKIIGLVAAKA